MAKYQKYAEYQDSGVEWLGEIPKDWGVLKLKYAVDLISEKSQDINQKYVGMENITSKNGKYVHTEEVIPEGISNTFKDNDVLFGKLRPYLAKSWLASFSGICSSELLVLRAKEICPKFLQYYTLTDEFINQVDSSTYGSKMPRASWEFISLLSIPKCSFDLSIKIANFLDHETAQIDTLIAKQEKLIELLKEKRQAVISHAVTKGLNPEVKMKDSGVEWLGQVPDLWKIVNIQIVLNSIEQGSSPIAQNQPPQEDECGVLKISAVKKGKFIVSESKTLDFKSQLEEKYRVRKGDLLVTRANTPLLVADACVVKVEPENPIMMCDLVYRLNTTSDVINEFLCYWLLSNSGRTQIELDARGSSMTMAKVSQGHIKAWKVVLPSIEEQKMIVNYLDKKLAEIDNLINKAKLAIEIIKERRTALISSAVTGKIDVRNWQHPNEAKTELSA